MGSAPFSIRVRIAGTAHDLYFNILPGRSITVPPVKSHRSRIGRSPVTIRVHDLDPQEPIKGHEIRVLPCLHCRHGCVGCIITTRGGSCAWIYGNGAGSGRLIRPDVPGARARLPVDVVGEGKIAIRGKIGAGDMGIGGVEDMQIAR